MFVLLLLLVQDSLATFTVWDVNGNGTEVKAPFASPLGRILRPCQCAMRAKCGYHDSCSLPPGGIFWLHVGSFCGAALGTFGVVVGPDSRDSHHVSEFGNFHLSITHFLVIARLSPKRPSCCYCCCFVQAIGFGVLSSLLGLFDIG